MVNEAEEIEVPHDELCDGALKHYNEISTQAMHSNSLIPKAIEYYRRWRPSGERKTVRTPGTLMEALKEGWMFDPWLNTRGSPIIVGDQPYRGEHPALSAVDPREPSLYWVLVRGSPEKIARLEPFVELPVKEVEEVEEPGVEPYGLRTEYITYNEEGKTSRDPDEGFVIMHKDHIYKAGTVYTKTPRSAVPTAWDVAKSLAGISHLGVDEAHDVIMGVITQGIPDVIPHA